MNAVRLAMAFKAGGKITSVAPHIIGDFGTANDPRRDRTRCNADAHGERQVMPLAHFGENLQHRFAELDSAQCMVSAWQRHARHRHIGIADGLDLLESKVERGAVDA